MRERMRYSMLIQWSDEGQAYLVRLPEWADRVFGPVTHDDTYEEAVRNGHDALAALIARQARSRYGCCNCRLPRRRPPANGTCSILAPAWADGMTPREGGEPA